MKIYILAGETSGDVHGADLIQSILKFDSNTQIRAMGGPLMKAAGAKIAFDYREFAIMGFVEVAKQFRSIKRHFKNVKKDIIEFTPDKVIMIDYPGFNLRLAQRLPSNISLSYYIAPKAWAWKAGRAKKLAQYFDKVYSILPFEVPFFEAYDVPIKYVGNPSKSQVERYIAKNGQVKEDFIALFPGSRKQEVERILPIMLEAIRGIDGVRYKISQAPALGKDIYKPFLKSQEDLIQENYELLRTAKAALVTSGTATLETALFDVPQVVCYVGNSISIKIAKLIVKIKYISLVNLILDRLAITELIQEECNPKRIQKELSLLLYNAETKAQINNDYLVMRNSLSDLIAADEVTKDLFD